MIEQITNAPVIYHHGNQQYYYYYYFVAVDVISLEFIAINFNTD